MILLPMTTKYFTNINLDFNPMILQSVNQPYYTLILNMDKGKDIRFVFCDISKAIERIWHNGLLFKLKHYGAAGNVLLPAARRRSVM